MKRVLPTFLLVLVLCVVPAAFAETSTADNVVQGDEIATAEVTPEVTPDVLEPLPWELQNPEYASASCGSQCPDYCDHPCVDNSQCLGICPGGGDAFCLRGFGTCGGSSYDKFCQCI